MRHFKYKVWHNETFYNTKCDNETFNNTMCDNETFNNTMCDTMRHLTIQSVTNETF